MMPISTPRSTTFRKSRAPSAPPDLRPRSQASLQVLAPVGRTGPVWPNLHSGTAGHSKGSGNAGGAGLGSPASPTSDSVRPRVGKSARSGAHCCGAELLAHTNTVCIEAALLPADPFGYDVLSYHARGGSNGENQDRGDTAQQTGATARCPRRRASLRQSQPGRRDRGGGETRTRPAYASRSLVREARPE